MKIKTITLSNFRGYHVPTNVSFNDLTVFVGRNDIGKSSILEALDIFFNEGKGAVKLEDSDICIVSRNNNRGFEIDVTFTELPAEVVIDATYKTNLSDEYLLDENGDLVVVKKFNGKKCTGTYIRALHPTNPECSELHKLKSNQLKAIIKNANIDCDNKSTNAVMRRAIWDYFREELQLNTRDIDVTSGDDAKQIWVKLSSFLPVYSLFRSDRQNTDGDKEVQDPLKAAVAVFFQDTEIQEILTGIASQVEEKLKDVSERTLRKLSEMDPNAAKTLKPVIPSASTLKWADVFKSVSITADDDIPINKRGSGLKRLILLNFFRAEAERRQMEEQTGIIYAIEEPETSQHFENQKMLADAFIALSKTNNTQVILTTHSGIIVKKLEHDDIRLVSEDENGFKKISPIQNGLLGYPSLNEVNYTAFGETTEEYHDELWGYIDSNRQLSAYESGKKQIPYIILNKDGSMKQIQRTLTHYIRDVMHHPENTNNRRYTDIELRSSIEEMRNFIAGMQAKQS